MVSGEGEASIGIMIGRLGGIDGTLRDTAHLARLLVPHGLFPPLIPFPSETP